MQIALYEPEIPPNTGTIARLCAATTTPLNLVEPLGFSLEDRYLKRAGLDYWPYVDVRVWKDWATFLVSLRPENRLIMTSARRGQPYHMFMYRSEDIIVLGPETRGLPKGVLNAADHLVRIPIWGKVRSINLANCASILLYEGLRQTGALNPLHT